MKRLRGPLLATTLLLGASSLEASPRLMMDKQSQPHMARRCHKHKDCAFLPRVCDGCPPCSKRWREVGNLKTLARRKRQRARASCPVHRCRYCPGKGGWLGTAARCVKGYCRAIHRTPKATKATKLPKDRRALRSKRLP